MPPQTLGTGARALRCGWMPGGAIVTHRAFLDGLMPFFCTDWYRKRIAAGQEFFTARYEIFFRLFSRPHCKAGLDEGLKLFLRRAASRLNGHALQDRAE